MRHMPHVQDAMPGCFTSRMVEMEISPPILILMSRGTQPIRWRRGCRERVRLNRDGAIGSPVKPMNDDVGLHGKVSRRPSITYILLRADAVPVSGKSMWGLRDPHVLYPVLKTHSGARPLICSDHEQVDASKVR